MTYASGITYWEAFLPGVVMALLAAAVLPWLNRDNIIVRGAAIGVCVAVTWRYLYWRLCETLPPAGLTWDFATGATFMTVETLTILGATASLLFLTRARHRSADVDRNQAWLKALAQPPRVDVLICTYNEEEQILERTIIGAKTIDYPNYRVWVCDDGRRAWLEALCERHGCRYLTRCDNAHAKAGNINNALAHLNGLVDPPDFISILDADFVAKPQFLTRTLSLMCEEDVGVVQTPQHFLNPDPIQTNLSMERVWPDEQRFFFDVVMPSKDAWGGAFCCGTSSLIRFAPLIEIGGFPTDSVTEDYLLSLRLKEIGYRTVYLNEVLSTGLAPEGLKEYITQRSRWALGFMQICRSRSGPLSRRARITLIDRIMLVETFLHWSATHLFRLFGLVIPALYLLFDIQAVHASVTDAVSYVFPYFITTIAIMCWMTRGRVLPILIDLSQLLSAADIVKSVTMGLVKPKGHKFRVTAKGGDRSSRFVQWPMLRVFLIFLGLTVAGIVAAFAIDDSRPLADASALALFWSWYNIILLTLACFVCIEAPQRRNGERYASNELALLTAGGKTMYLHVGDISMSGMRLMGTAPAPVGSSVTIHFNGLDTSATIARVYLDSFGVRFEASPQNRASLIRHIYCGTYSAAVEAIHPSRVAAAVIDRVLR
jgi:cellulose synthase (UDP-forming)